MADAWDAFPLVQPAQADAAPPQAQGGSWDAFPVVQPAAAVQPADAAQGAREAAATHLMGHHYATPDRIGRVPDSTVWGDVGHATKQFGRGVAEGVTNTVAPFVNSAALSEPGGLENQPAQPETLQHVIGSRLPDPGEPDSRFQSMARAGGNMTGAALPIFGAGTGLAKAGLRFGVEEGLPGIAGVFNRLKGGINAGLDSAAAKPIKTGLTEAVANAEGGAFGDLAKEKAREHGFGPAGQAGAEVFGGLTGPSIISRFPVALAAGAASKALPSARDAVGKVAGNAASFIPDSARPQWLDTMANEGKERQAATISETVRKQLEAAKNTPSAKSNIATADRLEGTIPSFKPGIAEKTGDQNLLNTQAKLDTAAEGENLTKRQQAYDANTSAVSKYYDKAVPPAEQPRRNPAAVGPQPELPHAEDSAAAAGNRRVEGINQRIGQQEEAANRQLQANTETLPNSDRIGSGERLRASRTAAEEASSREVNRLRDNIGARDTPIRVGDQQMTVDQALNRRAAINQEIRDYTSATARTQADIVQMRALNQERDRIDAAVGQVNDPGLRAYTNYYRDTHVPQFVQGASGDIGRRDQFGYGGQRVDPEGVGNRWFRPNEESAARQFQTTLGHDPRARQEAIDHALDDLRHTQVDPATGLLRPNGVARWLQKNERVVREVPYVREAIQSRDPSAIYQRLGELQTRRNAVGDTKLAKVLSSSSGPGKEPSAVIDAALKDHTLMRQLVNSTRGDEQSAAALRRGVFNRVRESAPGALDSPEKFKEWLRGHNRSLSAVLTPEHLKSLNDVADAAAIMSRRARPEGASAIPKSIAGQISDAVGLTPGSAAASALSVARGRTNPMTEVMGQGLRVWNKQTERLSNAAWDEALSNPDMARTVAAVVKTGKATPIQVHRMYTHLVSAGLVGAEKQDEERGGGTEK